MYDGAERLIADRYHVLRVLGRGGMGEVVLARQVKLDRLVVVKRPVPSRRATRALLDEARIAARLHHPNIVTVLDVSSDDEAPFVAMEYVAGVSLREVLERAAPDLLPLEVALVIAIDILRGLAYAHGVQHGPHVGVVHRDVKPRNVMVTFAGVTKLIDFGISRWLGENDVWDATSVSGTLGYMAPEHDRGDRVDGRADQYAVAVTLCEMVTGAPPVDGETTSSLRPTAATQSDRGGSIDPALAAIVARGSAADPAARFADCADMVRAIEELARDRGLSMSTSVVERWVRGRFAREEQAWEREAGGKVPSDRAAPSTGPTREVTDGVAVTVVPADDKATSRQRVGTPASISRALRRRWVVPAVVTVTALATIAIVVAIRWRSSTAAAVSELRVAVATRNVGPAEDGWLGPVIQRMTHSALRDAEDRRFWLTGEPSATMRVEITFRRTADAIELGARGASQNMLATSTAASVAEAVVQLASPLALALGTARRSPGPDPAERAAMKQLGAPSFDGYRRYRRALDGSLRSILVDTEPLAADVEQLILADPGWAHPYGLLATLRGSTTPAAQDAVSRGRRLADRLRDPAGVKILSALERIALRDSEAMAEIRSGLAGVGTEDILAMITFCDALTFGKGLDEAIAVTRRLHQARPDLQFGSGLAFGLRRAGRTDDAVQVTRTWAAAFPESEQSIADLVQLEAEAGHAVEAERAAQKLLLIHGQRPEVLGIMYDAYIASGELHAAHRMADQMLLGTASQHAHGRYRLGVIAVLEGRFAAAYDTLNLAADENRPLGWESDLPQVLILLRALAPLAGQPGDEPRHTAALIDAFTRSDDTPTAAAYRFEAALAARGTKCPSPEPFLADLSDASARNTARRRMLRAAAVVGCARCKDVVIAGFASDEPSTTSLVALGTCAHRIGELELARQSLEKALRGTSAVGNQSSAFDAVLARYHLAQVLAELGDRDAARAEYDAFLRFWGNVDRPLPEVAAAKQARAALGPPTPP